MAVVPAAAEATLLFVDVANAYGEEVVQNYTSANATVGVEWTGTYVNFSAENTSVPGVSKFHRIYFAPPTGEVLEIGAYPGALASPTPTSPGLGRSFDGTPNECYGGDFVVTALDSSLQEGVPTTRFEFAASFTQTCGTSEVHGEVRYESTVPASAVGYADRPQESGDLLVIEPDTIVGGQSAPGSIVLKNYGNAPLTFGTPTFVHESDAVFQVTSNTCASQPLAPSATCTISVRARQWLPGFFTDHFTVPVSTARGQLAFRIYGTARPADLISIDPTRIVDTRAGLGIGSILQSGQARTIQIRGSEGIPADAVAIVGNLTITNASSDGYAAMTTSPDNSPAVSTINTRRGDTRANGLIVRLTDGGAAAVTWVGHSGSTAHAIFDATGYFVQAGAGNPGALGFSPIKTFRVVDTRIGIGISTSILAGTPRTFTVPLPAAQAGHKAIAANLTVVAPSRAGYLAVTSVPDADPQTSTLNFPAGDTRANNLIARLGANRKLSIVYMGPAGSRVNVTLDVAGSFGTSGGAPMSYVPLVPNRVIDTRSGMGIGTKLQARVIYPVLLRGKKPNDPSRNAPDISGFRIRGFTGNATIVGQDSAGFLSVYPEPMGEAPTTSTVNAPLGDVRANGVILGSYPNETGVAVYFGALQGRSSHFIFDVTGYFWAAAT